MFMGTHLFEILKWSSFKNLKYCCAHNELTAKLSIVIAKRSQLVLPSLCVRRREYSERALLPVCCLVLIIDQWSLLLKTMNVAVVVSSSQLHLGRKAVNVPKCNQSVTSCLLRLHTHHKFTGVLSIFVGS